jgi:hypothetical protein
MREVRAAWMLSGSRAVFPVRVMNTILAHKTVRLLMIFLRNGKIMLITIRIHLEINDLHNAN